MTAIKLNNGQFRVTLAQDGTIDGLTESRDGFKQNLVESGAGFGSLNYTLKSDCVAELEKVPYTPYVPRKAVYGLVKHGGDFAEFENAELGAVLRYELDGGGLKIELNGGEGFSQFGINLPFNFLSKLNGGNFKEQFLFSSPYSSFDNGHIYCYLTRPDGLNFAVYAQNEIAGWKMDYSPYSFGHFFVSLNMLANFDGAYNFKRYKNRVVLRLRPETDIKSAQKYFSGLKNIPVARYEVSGGLTGTAARVEITGEYDKLKIADAAGEYFIDACGAYADIPLRVCGITRATPYYKGAAGADCTLYAYDGLGGLYAKAMASVKQEEIYAMDANLCEQQCWISAMLRYMRVYGRDAAMENQVKAVLGVIMTDDERKAVPRLSLFPKAQPEYQKEYGIPALSPYNAWRSNRVQEMLFGVTTLLDAFRTLGDIKYLDYAALVLKAAICDYLKPDGMIERFNPWYRIYEDYTTVTCLIIPVVDMALELRKQGRAGDAAYFSGCAEKIAAFLYRRGMNFPTEGDGTKLASAEYEDGSMSCTALSLLYFCRFFEYKQEYADKAKEILDLHKAWRMYSPLANMYGSTLRWWETIWEGDSDGPSLCAGHAWTIWRAEADLYLALFNRDTGALLDAYNGFTTNFAKIQADGVMYTAYIPDYIAGGGETNNREEIEYRTAKGFPRRADSGISRYVFTRCFDSFGRVAAILDTPGFCGYINARCEEPSDAIIERVRYKNVRRLKNDAICFDTLYADGAKGIYLIDKSVEIVAKQNYKVLYDNKHSLMLVEFY